jgi:NDP-sugar pyrophosphorylase family protein
MTAPVIILCGGLGTRLRSIVSEVPKVLAEINGRPFLAHVLDRVRDQGFRDVFLSTGYLANRVKEFVDGRPIDNLSVRCIPEDTPLGTAGAVRHVWQSGSVPTPFTVLNGDTFFGGNLRDVVAAHVEAAAAATLAVVRVPAADRYGLVRFDDSDRRITAFQEKGTATGPAWINAGAYVVERAVVESIPADRSVSLEREVFPEWIDRGLYACPFPDAPFLDIGTPGDYTRAQNVLRQAAE